MDTKQKIIIAILMLGTLMGSLDSTIVILAFPTISDSLHAEFVTTLWIILIYLLVVAICTTQLGRIGDIYGRSRMFNAGFGIFTVGSLFCGLSPGISWLIASRGVQAVGGALMQANSGAIVADTFPPNVRGTAFGYISLGWTSGAMLGIVLGGIITTFVGWEYIFFVNIPIGIIATILGFRYLTDNSRVHAELDLVGMLLLGAALTFISYAGVDFATEGTAFANIASLCIGFVILLLFIVFERRTSHPIIDFSALRNRILRYSIMATFFLSLGYLSVVFLITMYLQGIRALSPLDAALLLTPGYVVGSLLSPRMGRLSDKYGARVLATAGTAVLIVATLIYLVCGIDTPLWEVLVASGVSGLGTAMFFPSNNSAVMANAPQGSYGGISGILRTMQNIGILGSFVIAITVSAASIPRDVAFEVFIGTTNLVGGVSEAFIKGIDAALWVSIMLIGIAGALSWMRGRETRGSAPRPEEKQDT
ncbi:major facilitator superfamily MFS_1 [Methanoregula boonei 6A8]|jgi:EmrB/QacA subfamily drug resistance transporter|uniref:Major facilitator superfamily MFS_1 n=1 Tax=Methanoregula boonei (strain DSM 21154 / JCM 14090 / 6A8) TaxID=456442 RepID=A7I4C0_METB6|nr:MFS transporter [Methanoregula boonei]ABS54581.1 major facilitator superfamily MFS_1 [Methanoregula boonei 6A8]